MVVVVLIFLTFLICGIIFFFQFIYFMLESYLLEISDSLNINHSLHHFDLFPSRLEDSKKEILSNKFIFYNQLTNKKKKVFETRIAKILKEKTFETREEIKLTDEIKVLIAASIVHLTFGLSKYRIHNFKTIIVYPSYYLSATGNYHLGEVNRKGIIILSWQHFIEGYHSLTDKKNLGLHEMAHALFNQNVFYSKGVDTRFSNYYEEWKELCYPLLLGLRKNNTQTVLRDYALTNMHEFFSVSIECFFESPNQFKTELPELYSMLKKMLNQDPTKNVIN